MNRNKILIYSDDGCSDTTIIKNKAQEYFSEKVEIKKISANQLLYQSALEDGALALIMPGGVANRYYNKIGVLGNKKIRQFVDNGGIYLGICAGAYYACKNVEFELDVPQSSVKAQYRLDLVDACAKGSLYKLFGIKPFSKNIESVDFVELIDRQKNNLFAGLYHGGPWFDICDKAVSVVADYKCDLIQMPGVLEKNFGNGKVILSGVHFEASFDDFSKIYALDKQNHQMKNLVDKMKQKEFARKNLFNNLMKRML